MGDSAFLPRTRCPILVPTDATVVMALTAHSMDGILHLAPSESPAFLSHHVKLLDGSHSLFTSFVVSADGSFISEAFLLVPLPLLTETISPDAPVGIQGVPRVHEDSASLKWEILVLAIDFQPLKTDPYKHSSVGKMVIELKCLKDELLAIDPLRVGQAWVVEIEDDPLRQYWCVPVVNPHPPPVYILTPRGPLGLLTHLDIAKWPNSLTDDLDRS